MKYLLNRLKEPSSWAGLSSTAIALALMFGIQLDSEMIQAIVGAGAGLSGLIAFFLVEKGEA